MTMHSDIVVIGGGPGGHAAAVEAARRGAGTVVIERQGWGGACTHRGCIPTKALLACSRPYADFARLKRLGVKAGEPSFDYAAMKRHQEQLVKVSALGARKSLEEAGATLIAGEARIVSSREVQWTSPDGSAGTVTADRLIIAWGAEPALPPGIEPSARVLTSDGLLALPKLPESIVIVGGNVIGVEFATLLAELGARVTLVEWLPGLLPGEEAEAAALVTQALTKLGVAVHCGMKLEAIEETETGVKLRAVCATPPAADPGPADRPPAQTEPPRELAAAVALICTGRRPSLRTAELDALGIRYDRRGIAVDAELATSCPGVYAVGDVTGGPMLAHRAMHQGKVLAARLCGDGDALFQTEAVPAVVYAHPPVARVGLTEKEARDRGLDLTVRKADFGANLTARTQLLGPGFVKLLFAGERLVGATVAGEQAGELIAPLSLAMSAGLGRRQLQDWVIPHPTLSEILAF